ncbi:MAG: iron-containing alcohol dehydrogenase [Candidatus Omnitrophica bacterium]|nr:iron-containing alcohol dehydrogenase [Candidatus Omnitrophota bacterium]
MQNFEFHNPTKLIFGRNTIRRIGKEIREGGINKILLVAGGGSIKKNGIYQKVVKSLKRSKIEWVECWGIQPNPILSKVREVIGLARRTQVEALLAVGGGSVIDSSKAAAAGFYMEDVWEAFEEKESLTRALPLYVVLTLSATGTEMNPFAVVTNEYEKKKWNIAGPALYPRVSIVDPSVQFTLPWKETVNGALDAMSHIMEQYFMGLRAETTLAVDEGLFRTIVEMTDKLKTRPDHYKSRASFAWAATLALNGISRAGQGTGDWASHGIEHGVSAFQPKVAHGAGLGVIFPAWILYCQSVNPPIFKRWAKKMWDADTVQVGVDRMRAKIRSWNGATTLQELGVPRSQLSKIASHTLDYGMTGNIKKLTYHDIMKILNLAYAA